MRVALTGAHGVGKSTLAEELAGTLDVPVLPTPGRTLAARGLPINDQASVTSQTLAWLLQFAFERERNSWVAPRTLIDVWAYAVQAAERRELSALETALLEELHRATPLAALERYDELLYIPPRIALQGDGVRPTDEEFQRSTDAAILTALSDWRVPHTVLDVTDRGAIDAELERLRVL
ncbi:MAG TPA: AAA family ATPase [Solirubrobacteraceae bacterium]|nr:AAA family ATPase [Solirubrobacteraceae bacterium]